jgi:hypothetical protein
MIKQFFANHVPEKGEYDDAKENAIFNSHCCHTYSLRCSGSEAAHGSGSQSTSGWNSTAVMIPTVEMSSSASSKHMACMKLSTTLLMRA